MTWPFELGGTPEERLYRVEQALVQVILGLDEVATKPPLQESLVHALRWLNDRDFVVVDGKLTPVEPPVAPKPSLRLPRAVKST